MLHVFAIFCACFVKLCNDKIGAPYINTEVYAQCLALVTTFCDIQKDESKKDFGTRLVIQPLNEDKDVKSPWTSYAVSS